MQGEKIRILSEALANQIAAGEVVERPASVVKELVENSLDAGAGRILVEVEKGGVAKIRVTDDGEGMIRDDAVLCLERHATSKIRDESDLFEIETLGFRGEAIPSIASVSRMEIRTRTEGEACGTLVRVAGGAMRGIEDVGCPKGTSITVADLFWNTPARRKFLKSVNTELGHITETVDRIALAHPSVHFELSHNGRRLRRYPAASEPRTRIAQVLGKEIHRDLFEIREETKTLRLHAFASSPARSAASSKQIHTFLNGRYLRDKVLIHAVAAAYQEVLPKDRFPLAVLYLWIDPALVDVNVHPQKSEVRFRHPTAVHDTVMRAFSAVLREKRQLTPSRVRAPVSFHAGEGGKRPPTETARDGGNPMRASMPGRGGETSQEGASSPAPPHLPSSPPSGKGFGAPAPHRERVTGRKERDLNLFEAIEAYRRRRLEATSPPEGGEGETLHPSSEEASPIPPSGGGEEATFRYAALHLIGQLRNTYLLCQAPDGLLVIDQHAAHERVVYERLRAEFRNSEIPKQGLLLPVTLHLGLREAECLNAHLHDFASLGFEIESFSGTSFLLRSVPLLISGSDYARLFRDLVDHLSEVTQSEPFARHIDAFLATMACHASVRAGKAMERKEMQTLLEELDETPFGTNCPHGRPLFRTLTWETIEKLFGRR